MKEVIKWYKSFKGYCEHLIFKTFNLLNELKVTKFLLNEQGKVCNLKVYIASHTHKSIIALNIHNRWWVTTWKKTTAVTAYLKRRDTTLNYINHMYLRVKV